MNENNVKYEQGGANSTNKLVPKTFKKGKKVFKIIVIGDAGVGKTLLTYRFCEQKIPEIPPQTTIGVDFRERVVNVGGENIKLQLWDTAGQERFRRAMVSHYYRNTNAVVVVYDVTSMASFRSVLGWLAECEEHGVDRSIPRILVGNKCDCVGSVQVGTNFAQRVADAHSMPLFETSALTPEEGSNIDAIFMILAIKLVREQPLRMIGPETRDAILAILFDEGRTRSSCSC